ncbi:MAG: tRNA (adenosine(37)-N6)-threonylcarbamoyltransferase complex transferase subunit TsaD [Myxococcales bacterium]|nr:tRNA (adenosine(37)-N6)-threonylcarbamoyltransferase complex transferase subunit TsaD [Myxococcales bacterium]
MIVLGIESSCDETAAALVRDDGLIVSDVVASQVKLHAPFGGVVPELASRAHMRNLVPVLEQALGEDGLDKVDAIAVTNGPGLVGALLVGVQAAKAMAMVRGLPLVGVNHLVGHLLSVALHREGEPHTAPEMPFIALVASGGHTALYEVRGSEDVEQLGQTRDDAAGEAFDKVAKLLGLGYPGGPRIDALAAKGEAGRVPLPRPMKRRSSLDFSFSGLKTAVAQQVRERGVPEDDAGLADFCASFQSVVITSLVDKSIAACKQRKVPRLVITGGVAANRGLRALAAERCAREGIEAFLPPPRTCTDNAAMIAYAGACRLRQRGDDDGLGLPIFSRSPILGAKPGSAASKRYRSMRLPRE